MSPEESNREEIELLLEKSTDELLLIIADNLIRTEPRLGLDADNDSGKIFNAKIWLSSIVPKIRKEICGDANIQKYISQEKTFNKVTIVASIADIIVTTISKGIPSPLVVAALIIKEGLRDFCDYE